MVDPHKIGTMAAHDPKQSPPSTADQLRGEIDAGKAGDKAAASDPAAVPLGADDEAGGAPNTGEQIARARAEETRR